MLDSIFQELMQEGSSIQCLLWADHRVGPFLKGWSRSARHHEVYAEIAKQRSAYYLSNPLISPRMYRFILSYSVPYSKINALQSLLDAKEKLLNAMRALTRPPCGLRATCCRRSVAS